MIRDPLALVPVRYKLPLTFALLCVVAFGLGGYVVTTRARDAMERQIELRLDDRATDSHRAIDRSLELLGRRVEDFASDGHIRLEFESLQRARQALDGESEDRASRELVRHLRVNKLPLVPEFVDAYLVDTDGEILVRAFADNAPAPVQFGREALWYGPLSAATAFYQHPSFVLSTPLRAIDGERGLGFLQIVVRADLWAERVSRILAQTPMEGLHLGLSSPGGHQLPIAPAATRGNPTGRDWIRDDAGHLALSLTNPRTQWRLQLTIDPETLTLPVSTLITSFVYVGIALVALAVLLLLPSRQFLLKPLAALEAAARRISEGDFSTRVGYRSDDEVGQLSRAFDVMAGAIEERTRRLARAATDLEHREREVRFERDRLNSVIHSMEDGLFFLDGDGDLTLANAAGEEVLAELSKGRRGVGAFDCGGDDRPNRNCRECLADYQRPAHGCTISIGPRVFDLQTTVLRDPEGGDELGRIFVSRDITERTRLAGQQAHQERMSVLGEVAAVMAHEMNNPLAAISMFSQMLRDGLEQGSPLQAHAEIVHRNTLSCKRTIGSLLDMATTPTSEWAEFQVRGLLLEVVELLRPVAERALTALHVDAEAQEGLVRGDELQLRQALTNLVMNAVQALAETPEGEVHISSRIRGEELVIRVADNGPGVPDEVRERIFDPFFTTKAPGTGTGLGLPTTQRVATAHGGRLELISSDAGAVFELGLPCTRECGDPSGRDEGTQEEGE